MDNVDTRLLKYWERAQWLKQLTPELRAMWVESRLKQIILDEPNPYQRQLWQRLC